MKKIFLLLIGLFCIFGAQSAFANADLGYVNRVEYDCSDNIATIEYYTAYRAGWSGWVVREDVKIIGPATLVVALSGGREQIFDIPQCDNSCDYFLDEDGRLEPLTSGVNEVTPEVDDVRHAGRNAFTRVAQFSDWGVSTHPDRNAFHYFWGRSYINVYCCSGWWPRSSRWYVDLHEFDNPECFECTGTVPEGFELCPGDQRVSADTPLTLTESCTSGRMCEYVCKDGYRFQGGQCIPIECTGTLPANAEMCEQKFTNVVRRHVSSYTYWLGKDDDSLAGFWVDDQAEQQGAPDSIGHILNTQLEGSVPLKAYKYSGSEVYRFSLTDPGSPWELWTPEYDSRSTLVSGVFGYVYTEPGEGRKLVREHQSGNYRYYTTVVHNSWGATGESWYILENELLSPDDENLFGNQNIPYREVAECSLGLQCEYRTDKCPNIDGMQSIVPSGYILDGGSCRQVTCSGILPTNGVLCEDTAENLFDQLTQYQNGNSSDYYQDITYSGSWRLAGNIGLISKWNLGGDMITLKNYETGSDYRLGSDIASVGNQWAERDVLGAIFATQAPGTEALMQYYCGNNDYFYARESDNYDDVNGSCNKGTELVGYVYSQSLAGTTIRDDEYLFGNADIPYQEAATCRPTVKCEYQIDYCPNIDGIQGRVPDGYVLDGGVCRLAVCIGTIPAEAVLCPGDDQNLGEVSTNGTDVPYREVATCGDDHKCEYTCPAGADCLGVSCTAAPTDPVINQDVTFTASSSDTTLLDLSTSSICWNGDCTIGGTTITTSFATEGSHQVTLEVSTLPTNNNLCTSGERHCNQTFKVLDPLNTLALHDSSIDFYGYWQFRPGRTERYYSAGIAPNDESAAEICRIAGYRNLISYNTTEINYLSPALTTYDPGSGTWTTNFLGFNSGDYRISHGSLVCSEPINCAGCTCSPESSTCNREETVTNPTGIINDVAGVNMYPDPNAAGHAPGRNATAVPYGDDITAREVCRLAGYEELVSYTTGSFGSPGDNKIARFDGTNWSVFLATGGNRYIGSGSLICRKPIGCDECITGNTIQTYTAACSVSVADGGSCTGTIPSNAIAIPGSDFGLVSNTPWTYYSGADPTQCDLNLDCSINSSHAQCTNGCGGGKCEYLCAPGFGWIGGECQEVECLGTLPTEGIELCPGTTLHLTADTDYSLVSSCTTGNKCEYTCLPGYILEGVDCRPAACTGDVPENAILCPQDGNGVLSDTEITLVESCSEPEGSDPKCEYMCEVGFYYDNGECKRDVCVPDAICTIPGFNVGGEACNVCCAESELVDWVNPVTLVTEQICCKATPNHEACPSNPRVNEMGQSCGSVGAECSGACLCTDNACIGDPDGEPATTESVCCDPADQEFNPITNQNECPCNGCPGTNTIFITDPASGLCYEQGPLLVEFNDQVLDGILHENMNFTLSDDIQKQCCTHGRIPGTNRCYCDAAQTIEPVVNPHTGQYDCPCCDGDTYNGDHYFLAVNGQCRLNGEPAGKICPGGGGGCPTGQRRVGGVCCDLTNIFQNEQGVDVCESCDTRPDDPTCGPATIIENNIGLCTSGQQVATEINCDDNTDNCATAVIVDNDGGTRVFYEGNETTVNGEFTLTFSNPLDSEFSILPRLGAPINFRLIDSANNEVTFFLYENQLDNVDPFIPADGDVWFRINGADRTSGGDKKRGEYIEWTRTAVVAHVECQDNQDAGLDSIFCGCAVISDESTVTHTIPTQYPPETGLTAHPLDTNHVLYSRVHESNTEGVPEGFTIADSAGNIGTGAEYIIDFIDRDAPDLSGSFSTDGGSTWNANLRDIRATDFESGDVQFRVTATDSQSLLWGEQMDIRGFTTSQGTAEGFYDDLCNQSVSVSELEGYRQRYGALPGGGNEGDASESRSISLNSVSPDATFFYVYACTQDNAGNIMARRFTFGTGGLGILGTADDMKGFSYSGASSRPSTECITRHWNALAQVERDAIPAEDEEAQQELFCYYRRILSAVEDEQPNLNQAFGESNNQRIRELNQAISQNIGSLTRGVDGFESTHLYAHLDELPDSAYTVPSKELIYYDMDDPWSTSIEGNSGKIVHLRGNESVSIPGGGSFQALRVSGQKTIIIEGGNLHIQTDMFYEDSDSIIAFVIKRDPEGHGGNVYVDKDVTNIVGLFFVDGAFMNVEGNGPNLTVLNAAQHQEKLRKQLLIYGMVSSNNTRGGSFSISGTSLADPEERLNTEGLGALGHCPFGTDYEFGAEVNSGEYLNCPLAYSTAIDFEVFRTFGLMEVTQDTIDSLQTQICADIGNEVPITLVGGISQELTAAWSGKRFCYQNEDASGNLRATDKRFRTYIEFDSRGIRENFEILEGN